MSRFQAIHPVRPRLRVPLGPCAVLWGLLLLVAGNAHAQQDFFDSSPGPLSESHATIDGRENCNDCHTNGRELSNDKCLDCHDHQDLRAQIRAGKGFHASAKVRGKKCESCHLEHQGRRYDLRGWRSVGGEDEFDHDLTGWPLKGKHGAIGCERCHKRTNRQGLRVYLGEDRVCGSCHQDDQPHNFVRRRMLGCERCHNESVWKPAKRNLDFDHNNPQDTAMPLLGSHDEVSCGKCHPGSKFNLDYKDPAACENCHKSPHDGHLFNSRDCRNCHSPEYRTLEKHRFDHSRETRFVLTGAHTKTRCYDCHTKRRGTRKPKRECETCHAEDNHHGSRFSAFGAPPKCDVCHPTSNIWEPTVFNHDERTRFDLTGKHAQIDCRKCHRGKSPSDFERFDPKTVGCMGCHEHAKVHDGEFKDKQCLECHKMAGVVEISESSVERYHGPESRFPLVQKHAGLDCEKCHINNVYLNTPIECGVRCHEDRLHKGTLGDYCRRCHSGGQWEVVGFDHSEDTKWPLEGLHQVVPECASCHPARQYADTPTTCSAQGCHAKDDVHEGKLGTTCDKCHQVTGANLFNHNKMSDYELDGAHLQTKCVECHPSVTFKPQPTNCFGCHPEPDVHKGQYGTTCENCHTTQTWLDADALHDVGDFALKGAHDNLPCVRCHKEKHRTLGGSGNLCINCHRQDDVHSNSLSPRCGECHTQWSFAPARFDHSTVGCFLTGIHRTLPCYDCHKSGNFGGLSAQCESCHLDTARAVGATVVPPHGNNIGPCSGCHFPDSWFLGRVGTGYGRESICR